jgi:uncharacterized protein YbgA (DUF1722 family)
VISRCIEFDSVRWNAQVISSDFVRALVNHVDYTTVCPEVEIGLGVPRDTLRLVKQGEELRLMQPATGLDVTEKMREFAGEFLDSLGEVDGFILKGRSPTSGLRGVKVYSALRFSHLALEEEGRLKNSRIREHFLRKLYTLARLREIRDSEDVNDLIGFHTRNKLLLKAYNQKETRALGRIVANAGEKTLGDDMDEYREHLHRALGRPPRCTSYVNVLMSSMGYFRDGLSKEEKEFFLDTIRRYRDGKIPLIVPVDILRAWMVRFDEGYLKQQTFFEPYPEALLDIDSITEACGGRDYWKEV